MRAVPSHLHARFAHRVRVATVILALFSASPARAVPGDELWSSRWCRPGADEVVDATAEHGGRLIVGGAFRFIGDVAASRVAAFDGVTWSPLGPGFNDRVNALVVYNGELYAGGNFTASGTTPLSGLARWTGSAWVDVGSGGVDGHVHALAVFNSALVVGGSFTEVGSGTSAGSIATWNGTAWGTMAGGFGESDFVNDLAVFSSALYVTGKFTIAGPIAANNIARWSGTTWSALGSGLDARGRVLAVYDGELFVGGDFSAAGGRYASGLASWSDPNAVSVDPGVRSGDELALAASPSPFTHSSTLSWNLSAPTPVRARVYDLAGRLVATLVDARQAAGRHVAVWDGRAASGERVRAGVYLCHIEAGALTATRRLVHLR